MQWALITTGYNLVAYWGNFKQKGWHEQKEFCNLCKEEGEGVVRGKHREEEKMEENIGKEEGGREKKKSIWKETLKTSQCGGPCAFQAPFQAVGLEFSL